MTNANRNNVLPGKRGATDTDKDTKHVPNRQRKLDHQSNSSYSSSTEIVINPTQRQKTARGHVPVIRRQVSQAPIPVASSLNQINPSSYQYGPPDNIDERDAEDPLCVAEYVQDMYDHFRSKETLTSVRPLYMETQTHINQRMRSILVDWLVEVHLKFKLVPETLYLTVNLIDRFLERQIVVRPKLQLVGVTALLIAGKYEEIYPPELRDLVYICDRAYSKDEVRYSLTLYIFVNVSSLTCISSHPLSHRLFAILQILEMEENILKTLDYDVTIPSAHCFLVRFLKAGHADKRMVQLSCYILDGTLQSLDLLDYLPSQLAAAAIFIARRTVGRNSWSPTLLRYASYTEEEIAPVAQAILKERDNQAPELRAVNKKYSSGKYGGVSQVVLSRDF